MLTNLFRYRIILVLNLTMRTTLRKESINTDDDGTNYKELYLDCKKKVAIFMAQVQAEISSILKKHESEKRGLQEEIERLRNELKEQSHNTSMHFSKISINSNSKRGNSQSKINTQTSISREAVEECLAKFSKISLNPKENLQKKASIQPITRDQRRVTFRQSSQQQKQNRVIPVNSEQDVQLGDLKLISAVPKRETRFKEKKVEGEKVENIKDVLKELRGKLTSREKGTNILRERDENIKSVITPDLFSSQRNKL